ncbi:anti-sigma factor RsbA family regulatory protein [Actinokineospora globicatena]|uniref:anti-sigma factor RsbA family regulatory protein n=1 Tax=Actinokineospora globicatena TaxID=103729 RepID=UPI0020A554CE|nr:anti-sigma factor RsbA family regulatory protein [Actinokineospora globicatena]MCP2305968.1 Anti-sigma regulatory factor (Ser/Thr protein kinase) [Actinokineospora globicatena]GLW80161.1 hypothetical protein Aglo01_46420 [Actinokineospora globicatena]GLW86990.1 hypothetical protein Aglo02_46290 [Actinokineospora globicatena]
MGSDSGQGYEHSALCHSSDRELLASALPFLNGGVDAGDMVVVALSRARIDLVLAELDRPDAVTVMSIESHYSRPASAIKSYRDLFAASLDGAGSVRVLGELPIAAMAEEWDAWARYEAAVNRAFAEFPVRTMCTYDTRVLSRADVDDVLSTHPLIASPTGAHPRNPGYVDPSSFLARPQRAEPDPLQHTPPAVELTNPSPSVARRAVAAVSTLAPGELEDLVVSVSEVVTNAHAHGIAPVEVRVWAQPGHTVVTVRDSGPGPTNPFAGLIPEPGDYGGGYGLWIAHQVCTSVLHTRDATGFTIRLTMGTPV